MDELEAKCNALLNENVFLGDKILALTAERDRYRAALEKIAETLWESLDKKCREAVRTLDDEAYLIAKEALGGR